MVRTVGFKNYSDSHYTREHVARSVIEYFSPTGSILEPFAGDGAFLNNLPMDTKWCEIEKGRDFFLFFEKVDWIVTNPPFSDLTRVMEHAFNVSEKTVFLLPLSKIYSSMPRLKLTRDIAGIKEHLILGTGRDIGFDIGFPFSATLFERGYKGPVKQTWKCIDSGKVIR